MGAGLYAAHPAYADAFDAVCAEFDRLLDRPLRDLVLSGPADVLDRTAYAQPALFAVETALAALLRHWGVTPRPAGRPLAGRDHRRPPGRSPLPAGRRRTGRRPRPADGRAAGRRCDGRGRGRRDRVRPLLGDDVSLAAVERPARPGALRPRTGRDRGRRPARRRGLPHPTPAGVPRAFHSALMDPMLAEFRATVAALDLRAPSVPVVSALTGRPLTAEEARSPEHWVRHVRDTVRFHDAVAGLARRGRRTAPELGPDGVLTAPPRAARRPRRPTSATRSPYPCCAAGRPEPETLTDARPRRRRRPARRLERLLHGPRRRHRRPAHLRLPARALLAARRLRYRYGLGGAPCRPPRSTCPTAVWCSPGGFSPAARPWLAEHTRPRHRPAARHRPAGPGPRRGRPGGRAWRARTDPGSPARPAGRRRRGGPRHRRRRRGRRPPYARPAQPYRRRRLDPARHRRAGSEVPGEPAVTGAWPPADARPADLGAPVRAVDGRQVRLRTRLPGLRAAWRRGEGPAAEVYAEAELPAGVPDADRRAVHPALLDAVLHAIGVGGPDHRPGRTAGCRSPGRGYGSSPPAPARSAPGCPGPAPRAPSPSSLYDADGLPVAVIGPCGCARPPLPRCPTRSSRPPGCPSSRAPPRPAGSRCSAPTPRWRPASPRPAPPLVDAADDPRTPRAARRHRPRRGPRHRDAPGDRRRAHGPARPPGRRGEHGPPRRGHPRRPRAPRRGVPGSGRPRRLGPGADRPDGTPDRIVLADLDAMDVSGALDVSRPPGPSVFPVPLMLPVPPVPSASSPPAPPPSAPCPAALTCGEPQVAVRSGVVSAPGSPGPAPTRWSCPTAAGGSSRAPPAPSTA
ncbi:acyltransferase domain-containing protein [Streptomyces tricolor]|nr:acyltransferase domain-containing protein [Streptomyces tricolor]